MRIHTMMLNTPTLAAIFERAECRHISGHANVAADMASRGRIEALLHLCAQAHVRAERVSPHPTGEALLEQATATAEQAGLEVAPPPAFLSRVRPRTVAGLDLAVDDALRQRRLRQGSDESTHYLSGGSDSRAGNESALRAAS